MEIQPPLINRLFASCFVFSSSFSFFPSSCSVPLFTETTNRNCNFYYFNQKQQKEDEEKIR
eukprot:m.239444 g.239444  ORF g.239444 m.239444 type:complete len:61 (-) comp13937_c0_seq12:40-222(-)